MTVLLQEVSTPFQFWIPSEFHHGGLSVQLQHFRTLWDWPQLQEHSLPDENPPNQRMFWATSGCVCISMKSACFFFFSFFKKADNFCEELPVGCCHLNIYFWGIKMLINQRSLITSSFFYINLSHNLSFFQPLLKEKKKVRSKSLFLFFEERSADCAYLITVLQYILFLFGQIAV